MIKSNELLHTFTYLENKSSSQEKSALEKLIKGKKEGEVGAQKKTSLSYFMQENKIVK